MDRDQGITCKFTDSSRASEHSKQLGKHWYEIIDNSEETNLDVDEKFICKFTNMSKPSEHCKKLGKHWYEIIDPTKGISGDPNERYEFSVDGKQWIEINRKHEEPNVDLVQKQSSDISFGVKSRTDIDDKIEKTRSALNENQEISFDGKHWTKIDNTDGATSVKVADLGLEKHEISIDGKSWHKIDVNSEVMKGIYVIEKNEATRTNKRGTPANERDGSIVVKSAQGLGSMSGSKCMNCGFSWI